MGPKLKAAPMRQKVNFMSKKTIKTTKYKKLQDLKGAENHIRGIYEGMVDLKYSPAYLIKTEGGVERIIGTTDLTEKMKQVKIGERVEIGCIGEIPTQHENPLFEALVVVEYDEPPFTDNETQ